MSDGALLSSKLDSLFEKLFSILILVIILIITISIIIRKISNKRKDKNNIDKYKGVIIFFGILFVILSINLKIHDYSKLLEVISSLIMPSIIITFIAFFYGRISGFLVGFLGYMIGCTILKGYEPFVWLSESYLYLSIGLYGVTIGYLRKKYISDITKTDTTKIIMFCFIQLICNIVLCMGIFFIPIRFYYFFEYLRDSILYFIGETLILGIIIMLYRKIKTNI